MKLRTIIISDLHLGTPDAQPQKLLKFLEKYPCENLILNGDIIDQRYLKFFGEWKAEYTVILTHITYIGEKNQTKIMYLRGNHERDNSTISSILGESQQETIITSNTKRYLICHGGSFQKEMDKPTLLALVLFFIDTFFGRMDRNLGTKYAISHFLKNIYAFLTNQKTRFIKQAIAYAKSKKVDGIICGHIHEVQMQRIDGIDYLNSGDRTETCSALTQDQQGNRKIVYAG